MKSVEHRMDEERQPDQAREQGGQMLLAMTIVVFERISLGLERIVVFVLDFPATAPARHQGDDVVGVDRLGTRPRVAVEHLALGIGGGEFAPADQPGVFPVAPR
jgi:hypothetical protein